MKVMSSREIKDRYGAFSETARRESVVHTSHGRPTLVTISIDRARSIPELRDELPGSAAPDRASRLARLLGMGGSGVGIVGVQSAEVIARRIDAFRGNE